MMLLEVVLPYLGLEMKEEGLPETGSEKHVHLEE